MQEGAGEIEGLVKGVGGETVAKVVEQTGPLQDVAHLWTVTDKDDGHTVGVAALNELFKGMGARRVEPENAGEVKDKHTRRRFLYGMKTAFQFVNGSKKKRSLNKIDGDAGRDVPRRWSRERSGVRESAQAGMGALVDEKDKGEKDAKQDGLRQVECQRGKEGDEENDAIRACRDEAEADGAGVECLHGKEHEDAAEGGHGHMGNERREQEEQGQGQDS